MLTIEREFVAMYLRNAALYRAAAELGDQLHTRALRAKRKNPQREETLWNLYWAARSATEDAVSHVRGCGALLHYGCQNAEKAAAAIEQRQAEIERARYRAK